MTRESRNAAAMRSGQAAYDNAAPPEDGESCAGCRHLKNRVRRGCACNGRDYEAEDNDNDT